MRHRGMAARMNRWSSGIMIGMTITALTINPLSGVAAERVVLGEEFTATW